MAGVLGDIEAGGEGGSGGERGDIGSAGFEGADEGVGGGGLDADHARAGRADQAEGFELVEGFGHADDAGAAAGGVDDDVGELPGLGGEPIALGFGHFEAEGFLALGAPAGFLEGGDVEVALGDVVFADAFGAVDDGAGDEVKRDVAGVELGESGDAAEDGEVGVWGHDDGDLEAGGDGVLGEGVAGVALGGDRQLGEAEGACHGDREGHASVFEGEGGVGAEAGVGAALVLDLEAAFEEVGERVRIGKRGGMAFAEGDDVAGVVGVVDVEREEAAEAVEVGAVGVIEATWADFGFEAVEVEDELDGAAVDGAEIHDRGGGIGCVTD